MPRYRCESEMTKRSHSIHDKSHQIVKNAGVAEKHLDNYEEDYLTDLLGRYIYILRDISQLVLIGFWIYHQLERK